MAILEFKLIKKQKLTHDVFEMLFEMSEDKNFLPGQFVTFLLDKIGGRAYSILEKDGKNIKLIIKKREIENGGRGGSKYICERKIGDILKGVGPAGHFLLQKNNKNKLFIGTGTGFVPLYNQILRSLKDGQNCKLKLLFGVRRLKDIFYEEKLEKLKQKNTNFDFKICVSREGSDKHHHGYTTDLIDKNTIKQFQQYYICGAPIVVDSVIKKLQNLGVKKDNIFFEKY